MDHQEEITAGQPEVVVMEKVGVVGLEEMVVRQEMLLDEVRKGLEEV